MDLHSPAAAEDEGDADAEGGGEEHGESVPSNSHPQRWSSDVETGFLGASSKAKIYVNGRKSSAKSANLEAKSRKTPRSSSSGAEVAEDVASPTTAAAADEKTANKAAEEKSNTSSKSLSKAAKAAKAAKKLDQEDREREEREGGVGVAGDRRGMYTGDRRGMYTGELTVEEDDDCDSEDSVPGVHAMNDRWKF